MTIFLFSNTSSNGFDTKRGMVDTHTYNAKINLVSNAKLVHKSFTKFLNVYAYMYMQSLSEKIVECLKMEI